MSEQFSIVAEFPLGTYRGAAADGRVDPLPSVSRLYSALLSAAGFGPRAIVNDDQCTPCPEDMTALRWIEEHLPDSVAIPSIEVNGRGLTAYRDDGTLHKSKSMTTIRKLPKAPDASVAVNGSFVWTWIDLPPRHVIDSIEALCVDVPYLGTTESPVRLWTTREPLPPTHRLDEGAGLFTRGGRDVDVPLPGRLAELGDDHGRNTGAPPSVKSDKIGSDERSVSPSPQRERTALARYAEVEAPTPDVPWPQVIVVPIDRSIPVGDRVRWSVATHRALIAALDEGAPPVLTGTYPEGALRPANRIAIQIIDRSSGAEIDSNGAILIMVPADIDAADSEVLSSAIGRLRVLRGPRAADPLRLGPATVVAGDVFWPEAAAGDERVWTTSPPAIPECRGWGSNWTFGDTAMLSLGYVWQGSALVPRADGRGEARARELVRAVTAQGAEILRADPLRSMDVQRYVHRVHMHAVVRPYRAALKVGRLGGDRTIQAIGQSRHLGGGLLVPIDLAPPDVLAPSASA